MSLDSLKKYIFKENCVLLNTVIYERSEEFSSLLLGFRSPYEEVSPCFPYSHCSVINERFNWGVQGGGNLYMEELQTLAVPVCRTPSAGCTIKILLLYWVCVNCFCYSFTFLNYHLCSKVVILHDMHLSCSTNFPVLYKSNEIMPVVPSLLTCLHCDRSSAEHCRDLPSVLPNAPLGLFHCTLFVCLDRWPVLGLFYSTFP